jgi:hypothetical protein
MSAFGEDEEHLQSLLEDELGYFAARVEDINARITRSRGKLAMK